MREEDPIPQRSKSIKHTCASWLNFGHIWPKHAQIGLDITGQRWAQLRLEITDFGTESRLAGQFFETLFGNMFGNFWTSGGSLSGLLASTKIGVSRDAVIVMCGALCGAGCGAVLPDSRPAGGPRPRPHRGALGHLSRRVPPRGGAAGAPDGRRGGGGAGPAAQHARAHVLAPGAAMAGGRLLGHTLGEVSTQQCSVARPSRPNTARISDVARTIFIFIPCLETAFSHMFGYHMVPCQY